MAGLIDVGILKPELANTFGAAQARQQAEQQNALRRQQLQVGELELKRLQEEREIMLNFQQQLKASGKDTDLDKIFDALISTGKPEYMMKGVEGKRKLQEQKAFAEYLRRTENPEAAMPTGAPAVAPAPQAPSNNLAAPQVSQPPVNNLVAPQTPTITVSPTVRELQNRYRQVISIDSPSAKAEAQLIKVQIDNALRAEAAENATPSDLLMMKRLGYPQTQEGYKQFRDAQRQERLLTPEEEAQKVRLAQASRQDRLLTPEEEAQKIRIAGMTRPVQNINLPPQEKAEQGDRGKLLVKQYEGISEAARIGARSLPALQSNLAILDKGFETGFGTEAKAAGAKVLAALGVQNAEKYATNAQTFLGNASAAILQRQLEQKGPQTEADAQRITQTGAQLGNTKEANKFFINVARAQINRDIDQRNFYDRWWKANKTYDGAEDAWYAGEGGKSLFERPELKSAAPAPSLINQIPTGRAPAPAAAKPPAVKPSSAPASGGWSVVR
jgi:hypothetical protein